MLELLHLSGQISLLVLLASALAAGIGWWMRGLRTSSKPTTELTNISLTTAPAPAHDEEKLQALQQRLAESEQQCSTALEQRDNAEQEARSQRELARTLEATQQRLNSEAAELRQTLTEIERRHAQQLSEQQDSAENLNSALQELRSRVMTAEAAAAAARADYQEVADQVARAKADAEMQKSRFAAAEKAQQAAEERSKQLGRELEKQCQAAQNQEQKLTTELQGVRAQLESSTQTNVDLQTALQQTKNALAHASTAAAVPDGTKPKRKPPTKRSVTVTAGESPVAAIQAADAAAQQSLLELQAEYEQRLSTVNGLDAATPVDKPALAAARTLLRDTQKRLAAARTEVERTARQRAALERTFAHLPESEPDDLTLLKGVKSILAGKLNALGIFTYQQILDWPAEDRLAYGEMLGFGNRIDRDDWVGQARKLQSEKQA